MANTLAMHAIDEEIWTRLHTDSARDKTDALHPAVDVNKRIMHSMHLVSLQGANERTAAQRICRNG